MRIGVMPESFAERIALALGLVPTPLFYSMSGPILASTLAVATKSGVFEALTAGPLPLESIASHCKTHPFATEKLLGALASAGFIRPSREGHCLTGLARKWLRKESPNSLHDMVLFSAWAAKHLDYLAEFLQTGKALNLHETGIDQETWSLYQRSMRAMASLSAEEVARRTLVPGGARNMLDIGGSHGLYSVALCRRHPGMKSVILDLPEAVDYAGPILAEEGMGDRVVHRAGDAVSDDLGTNAYDLVFMSQLAHHFSEPTNRALVQRVEGALRPGGVLVIQEITRRESPAEGGQLGAFLDLYFALTSGGGTWSFSEIAAWQRDAELMPLKPLRLRTLPGGGQQSAIKTPSRAL